MSNPERHTFRVYNQEFTIDKRFNITKELGHGAYGIVCSAKYTEAADGGSVAIKKVHSIFSKKILCKRALRELKLLRHFRGHKNIACLYDLDIVDPGNFNEIYLYEELMECDMHQIIRSQQPLTDAHYQSFIYQILCGLKYIHSADVLHRDLKPGNLLVNADCELKICDFGLARGYSSDQEKNAGFLTEYVATRWYRAPEIMLSFQSYSKSIDIWSVGCILAELLGGKPIFRGKDYVDQLNQILRIVGTPSDSELQRIGSRRAREYVKSLPYMPKVPFYTLYPNANLEALDLLSRMLAFDPANRITVEEALEHPYLKIWHDPNDEPVCKTKFDFSFEAVDDIPSMRQMILDEVRSFRSLVRRPIEEQEREFREEFEGQASSEARQENETIPSDNNNQNNSDAMDISSPNNDASTNSASMMTFSPVEQQSGKTNSIGNNKFQIPSGEYKDQDLPPKPHENMLPSDTVIDELERELEFGLDDQTRFTQ